MKNIRSAALLPLFLFAALLFSGVPAAARADLPAKGALKAQAAQALIDSLDKNLVIIDVRTPGEFSQAMCPAPCRCRWRNCPRVWRKCLWTNPCFSSAVPAAGPAMPMR